MTTGKYNNMISAFQCDFSLATDGYSTFPNVRTFKNLELCDIGHSDKVVVLEGEEE